MREGMQERREEGCRKGVMQEVGIQDRWYAGRGMLNKRDEENEV